MDSPKKDIISYEHFQCTMYNVQCIISTERKYLFFYSYIRIILNLIYYVRERQLPWMYIVHCTLYIEEISVSDFPRMVRYCWKTGVRESLGKRLMKSRYSISALGFYIFLRCLATTADQNESDSHQAIHCFFHNYNCLVL